MQQVLFHVFGLPIYGFGAMMFVTFVVCLWFASRRGWFYAGMPPERMQDLLIWSFITGFIGARITYMIQYHRPYWEFPRFWEGGIVFYGSVVGGIIGYLLFYHFIQRKLNVSVWKLADVAAPTLALGLALGRIGCYLNGCCYGNVACDDCPMVVPPAHFPLLTSPARDQLVATQGLQTSVGFTSAPHRGGEPDDTRTVVGDVEPGSPAEAAGVRQGDRVVGVDGQPNFYVIVVSGPPAMFDPKLSDALGPVTTKPNEVVGPGMKGLRAFYEDRKTFRERLAKVQDVARPQRGAAVYTTDGLSDLVANWPRGRQQLSLVVQRAGTPESQAETLPTFTPRTYGLYPTQLYETISMTLLFFLLLAYYPFRRHDGQLMVLLMAGYAIHRFTNEILRNDTPVEGFNMTLSQNGSVLVMIGAIVLELYLRRFSPRRVPPAAPTAPTLQTRPAG